MVHGHISWGLSVWVVWWFSNFSARSIAAIRHVLSCSMGQKCNFLKGVQTLNIVVIVKVPLLLVHKITIYFVSSFRIRSAVRSIHCAIRVLLGLHLHSVAVSKARNYRCSTLLLCYSFWLYVAIHQTIFLLYRVFLDCR